MGLKDGRISVSAIRAEGEEGRRFEVTLLNDGGGEDVEGDLEYFLKPARACRVFRVTGEGEVGGDGEGTSVVVKVGEYATYRVEMC